MRIKISEIIENPNQVRSIENSWDLEDLANSISQHGLLQPIKVRPVKTGFELIYGHRRLAAMRLLGWTECEVIIDNINDDESILQAIAENLQRENLDILEEAQSYKTLVNRGYTIKQIAELVNKPQGRISNRLSILRLPEEVQELVRSKKGQHTTTTELGGISPDSASRIVSAINTPEEAIRIADKAVTEKLNSQDIRELTALLKETDSLQERTRILKEPWQIYSTRNETSLTTTQTKFPQEKPQDSIYDLYHNKIIWNLHRVGLDRFNHFSIGYAGRTIQQFLELLKIAQVDVVIDIRSVPISRFRPDFSRGNLRDFLRDNTIQYYHLPKLGIPPEIRQQKSIEEVFIWYEKNVNVIQSLNDFTQELNENRLAFMCVETDPYTCHRHRLSQALENEGYLLYDL